MSTSVGWCLTGFLGNVGKRSFCFSLWSPRRGYGQHEVGVFSLFAYYCCMCYSLLLLFLPLMLSFTLLCILLCLMLSRIHLFLWFYHFFYGAACNQCLVFTILCICITDCWLFSMSNGILWLRDGCSHLWFILKCKIKRALMKKIKPFFSIQKGWLLEYCYSKIVWTHWGKQSLLDVCCSICTTTDDMCIWK